MEKEIQKCDINDLHKMNKCRSVNINTTLNYKLTYNTI